MSQSNYKWFVIGMLWFVCFLNYADRQAIFVLFPLLRSELNLSDVQLALVGSSFMWMYAAFGPVAGWLGDRFSRKGLILVGLFTWLCVTAATVLANRYWQLTLIRGLGGISEALYFPAAMSLISSYHNSETRSRAMSLHQSAVYAGTVGGGVIASIIGERFGWRCNFLFLGSLGLLLSLVLISFLKEPQRESSSRMLAATKTISDPISFSHVLKEILASPLVVRLIVAFIGANFVAMIFMVWLPSFLFRKFHMSLVMAGINATIYLQAASVAGVLCGGILADRLARRGGGGRMRTQAYGLLGAIPFLIITGWTPSVRVLIGAMIGFGFCKGIYESNIWASLYDVVRPELRATAVGFMNSLGWLGGGLAPLAMAAGARHFGMGPCLSATSAIYVMTAAILFWNANRASAIAPLNSRAG